MKSIKQFYRLLYINYILTKNGLDQLIVNLHLFRPFRYIVYFNPWNWFRSKQISRGEALRKSLEQLGPLFVKFGQALSTRPDILPADIALELRKLQDCVPPFPSEIALKMIETAYGQPADTLFDEFDRQPLASASIAQVHAARLKNGKDVVVKILRPNMREIIENDLGLLKVMASFAAHYWKDSRRFKPMAVVAEFERSMLEELNLQREAANGSQLRRNFHQSPLLYVPEIYWEYVRPNILVMERIYGIPVTNIESLKAHGINIQKISERGLEIFFTQVFRDRFFHADMHPGNIFVSYENPNNPQYICVDFGIIGVLNNTDTRYIAENLLAFFNQDYYRVAQLHIDSGWVSRNTRVEAFESDIRMVCEPIFEKPLKDISFAHLILQLFKVAQRYDMEVQPQLVLLQKTLLAVEGLGKQLYPELDISIAAKPIMEKWLRDQMGYKAFFKHCSQNLPFLIEQLPHMPKLVYDVLVQIKEQQSQLNQVQSKQTHCEHMGSSNWRHGVGTGLCLALSAIAGLSYLGHINQSQLRTVAVTAALFVAVVTLLTKHRSS